MPDINKPGQGPLTINVTVTNFVPLSSATGSAAFSKGFFSDATYDVAPGSGASWITIDKTTNRATHRPYIHVAKGANGGDPNGLNDLQNGIIFHFAILSATGDANTYVPVDIAFDQYEPNGNQDDDPDGTLTFPQEKVSVPPANPPFGNNVLEVWNLWGPGNPRTRPNRNGPNYKWRVYLLIKRVSDGAIGVIDPDLQNEN